MSITGFKITRAFGFCLAAVFFWWVTAYFVFHCPVDFLGHMDAVRACRFPSCDLFCRSYVHCLFHMLGMLLYKIISVEWSTVIIVTAAQMAHFCVIYFVLSRKNPPPSAFPIIFSVIFCVLAAIYCPWFTEISFVRRGEFCWINPTLTVVKPFAFAAHVMVLPMFEEKGSGLKKAFWLSLFLALSTVAKPSFIMYFLPALFVFVSIFYTKDFGAWKRFFVASIFPTLFFIGQSFLIRKFFGMQAGIDPFKVWSVYSPCIPFSLLLAIAFPLCVTVFRANVVKHNKQIILCWICTFFAYLQFALLIEYAPNAYTDGNFAWGVSTALPILFLFCIEEFIEWIKDLRPESVVQFVITSILLGWHAVSGVLFIYRFLVRQYYSF